MSQTITALTFVNLVVSSLHAPTVGAEAISIVLQPADGSDHPITNKPYFPELFDLPCEECASLVYVTSPKSYDLGCMSSEFSSDYEECSGKFEANLAAHDNLEIKFKAPQGQELEFSTSESFVRFDFQAKAECGSDIAGLYAQFFEGSDIEVLVDGSEVSEMVFDEKHSYIEMRGCFFDNEPDFTIFSRLQFTGPISNVQVESVSCNIAYNQTNVIKGPTTFHYGTEGHGWVYADSMRRIATENNEETSSADRLGHGFVRGALFACLTLGWAFLG